MLNVIVLAGNVVADPEVRTTTGGKSVATVRLAVNNPMNDEEVLYINVDVWDKQAEFVQKYVKKGNSVSTQGRLKQSEWKDNEGKKRVNYTVVADRINFFGAKKKVDDAFQTEPDQKETVVTTRPIKRVAPAEATPAEETPAKDPFADLF
jgi:single-strand DNA-binding protein